MLFFNKIAEIIICNNKKVAVDIKNKKRKIDTQSHIPVAFFKFEALIDLSTLEL
jgi:hypothetical protein